MRTMHKLFSTTTAAALACAVAGAATAAEQDIDLADTPSPTVTMRATEFHFLDLDRDGYITLNDVTDPVTRSQFPSLDRNHDGRLSEDEFLALK